jgi:hypothetical protein
MRSVILMITVVLLLLSSFQLHAEDNTAQQQQTETDVNDAKQYSTQSEYSNRRSRKCGIYSGVCPMSRSAKVGDYCICHTPSGPIHGVVIP